MSESRSSLAAAGSRSYGAGERPTPAGELLSEPRSADDVEALDLVLSEAQLDWIETMAAGQTPAVSAGTMLGRVIDDAMARHDEDVRRRTERLEVYRASGYSEHHPDYPNVPLDLRDV